MGKIVIVTDHKWRDLPGNVYAKLLLEKMGHKVYLCRNLAERRWVYGVKPDLIVLQHVLSDLRAKQAKEYRDMGIDVVIMPTEGLAVFSKSLPEVTGEFSDLSGISLNMFWGDMTKDYLVSRERLDEKRTAVIGCPRFDFYKEPLKKILMTKEQFRERYGINNDYPVILWAPNFWFAGFIDDIDKIRRDFRDLKTDKIWGDPERLVKIDWDTRKLSAEAVKRLVRDVGKVNVVIKPHPAEDQRFYQELKSSMTGEDIADRVRIINSEYIWDMLNVSDLLLQRSCTTAVENWLLDKPVIDFKINPEEWWFSKEMAPGNRTVSSYKELKESVEYYISGGQDGPETLSERENFLRHRLYKPEGNATKRFVEELDRLLTIRKKKTKLSIKRFLRKEFWIEYARYFIARYVGYWPFDLKKYVSVKKKIDRYGVADKSFNGDDIKYWERRLVNVIDHES